ncbi:hypothetical protein GCM10007977_015100 [Dactylosporangium sucinum]|uniref:Uncharacterized protein n=1 Tax=Dactylosporangium sucinum TaxID=1424081 RepID=A0A917T9Z4_9ACTN|nr:hypothetical protein GCM10007977_015100 [Dactylosporangium sucinum]
MHNAHVHACHGAIEATRGAREFVRLGVSSAPALSAPRSLRVPGRGPPARARQRQRHDQYARAMDGADDQVAVHLDKVARETTGPRRARKPRKKIE